MEGLCVLAIFGELLHQPRVRKQALTYGVVAAAPYQANHAGKLPQFPSSLICQVPPVTFPHRHALLSFPLLRIV